MRRLIGWLVAALAVVGLGDGAAAQEPAGKPAVVDAAGDPLPPGAIARFGTHRWTPGALFGGCAVSPDGTLVATGGHDERVRIFELASGREIRSIAASSGFVGDLAWAPDGTRIYAGGLDDVVRCWDVKTGAQLFALLAEEVDAQAIALSPDGTRLASAGDDGPILVWDPAKQIVVAQSESDPGPVARLVFAGDGSRLLSVLRGRWGRHSPAAIVWEASSGERLLDLTCDSGPLRELAVAPDGWTVAAAGTAMLVDVWDLKTGERRRSLAIPADAPAHVVGLAFLAEGRQLAVATSSGAIRGFDVETWKEVWQAADPPGHLDGLSTDSAGTVLVGHDSRALHVWDAATRKRLTPAPAVGSDLRAACFTSEGRVVLGTLPLRLWDPSNGTAAEFEATNEGDIWGLTLTADGTQVATAGLDQGVRFFELASRKQVRTLDPTRFRWLSSLVALGDGRRLLIGEYGKDVELWDLATGEGRHAFEVGQMVSHFALAPDGLTVAAASEPEIGVWRLTADGIEKVAGLGRGGTGVAFTPDGTRCFTGGGHGLACHAVPGFQPVELHAEWLAARTDPFADRPRLHRPKVCSLAADPSGKALGLGWSDGRVELFDLAKGDVIASVEAHRDEVHDVAFSRDGSRLVSVSADRTALAFDLSRLRQSGLAPFDDAIASKEEPDWPPPPPDPDPVSPEVAKRVEGIYRSTAEAWGYQFERLELSNGRFKYWFWTDVIAPGGPKYPLEGRYSMEGDRLRLHNRHLRRSERRFEIVNGRAVLWGEHAAHPGEVFAPGEPINPYGVIIRVSPEEEALDAPPSVRTLTDPALRAGVERPYEDRFADQPAEFRALLRAATERDDPERVKLRPAMLAARAEANVALFTQLVERIGDGEWPGIGQHAFGLLHTLVTPDPESAAHQRAVLERFVEALPSVRSGYVVYLCLAMFLDGVDADAIEVPVAGAATPLRVRRVTTERGKRYDWDNAGAEEWRTEDPATAGRLKAVVASAQTQCKALIDRKLPAAK